MDDSYLSPEARARIAENLAYTKAISREQRRYEIASMVMAAAVSNPSVCSEFSAEENAARAVVFANALLAELEKEPTR